ncbi:MULTISPECIES: ADP-glyceromanno-heptose 6-epimerase [unclassified Nitrospina]|uniref:ADP-glyceromanno-heptose 6-epimerase n=1 Tax=unclassified Nitrospina TaxID=2638683 RepID=UPI003F985859
MIIVTGGAGFIGSAIVHSLNQRGHDDIWIVDVDDHPEKKKNLEGLTHTRFLDRDEFINAVRGGSVPKVEALFHMGACSSTTETDEEFLRINNLEYTQTLARFALDQGARYIYASSAASYGNGEQGYNDDESRLDELEPLNPYGHSKHRFDLWARDEGLLKHIVGLKYFNVFGPNEYHKEDMRSMVLKGHEQVRDTGRIRLFKSYRPEYADGGQERDFVYIKDAVAMTLFFFDHPEVNGIFNIGSGSARNWNDLARAIFNAMGEKPFIEYIEMPASIRDQYQYHTCADIRKIREAGFNRSLSSLEEGVRDYICEYLIPGRRLGSNP